MNEMNGLLLLTLTVKRQKNLLVSQTQIWSAVYILPSPIFLSMGISRLLGGSKALDKVSL